MEIHSFIIVFTGIIPFIIYTTLFTILIIRLIKKKIANVDRYLLLRHIISLSIIGALYLTFCLTAFLGKNKYMTLQTELLIMLVYIVSLFLSCINYLHSRFINKVPLYFNILAVVCAFMVLFASIRILIAGDHPLLSYILKISVGASILFLIYDYSFRNFKRESDSFKNRTLYMKLIMFYNFIYLFYLIKIHPALDLIFAIYAYMAIHAVRFYFLAGRKKARKYNCKSNENSTLLEGSGNIQISDKRESNMIYDNFNDYEKEAISLKNRLLLYFEQEKPYLSKNISIDAVALKLYTNKTYLSKTINEELNKNFRELVNYFRIREAIKIFSENMEISMSELMDKSGFNNNASFTSAFKVNTGQTPGEWCRDIKNKN